VIVNIVFKVQFVSNTLYTTRGLWSY
jgi:hypothetical protein